ncbi:Crp/Fnr family transcriptional regulator [Agitococcus lubricus]|uniref:CRP-like cAMP-binding protein n=1 Tax=Agitococcus lubricus TaxID=1077255 RepID=A0A2T5J2V7_9GAMM|nr:Crp/Fnr family transcriptional regulator [Agitococcus lubricus]PTQ90949.1 CRP-like cAMP-binding protein [Agitococcus lubricus]
MSAWDYQQALSTGRWFAGLPEPLQRQLLSCAQLIQLTTGERLFARGDAFDGIYCVVKGALRIVGYSEAGKEALLTMAEPYTWFGEIALFDQLQRTHDAVADSMSTVLRIPAHPLFTLLHQQPEYWFWFGLLLSQKMRFAFIALEAAAVLPLHLRLARRLVLMAEGYGELAGHSRRLLPVSQEQLANMLSVSRQTINQVLRQFEAQHVIKIHYREIEIIDLEGLRHYESSL